MTKTSQKSAQVDDNFAFFQKTSSYLYKKHADYIDNLSKSQDVPGEKKLYQNILRLLPWKKGDCSRDEHAEISEKVCSRLSFRYAQVTMYAEAIGRENSSSGYGKWYEEQLKGINEKRTVFVNCSAEMSGVVSNNEQQ